jgi:hypothetical protein
VPSWEFHRNNAYTAFDQAEEALGITPPDGTILEQQEWLQIQIDRIDVFYWRGLPDQMEALIQKIEGLVASQGRAEQQNKFLSLRYQVRMRRERYRCSSETLQLVRQRLEQAEKLDDPFNLYVAQFEYGFALLWHGEPAAARGWIRHANDEFARMGARLTQLRCLVYLNVISRKLHEAEELRKEIPPLLELTWQDGDNAQAEQLCQEARKEWGKLSGSVFHALADWVMLAIAVAREDFSQSEAAARALMDPNPTFQPIAEPMSSQLSQALIACEAGNRSTALELFRRALEAAKAVGEV